MSTVTEFANPTTDFTLPTDCTSLAFWSSAGSVVPTPTWGAECFPDIGILNAFTCYPSTVSDDPFIGSILMYLPGLQCPSGFHRACTNTGPVSEQDPVLLVSNLQTAVGCCPLSYSCVDSDYSDCTSNLTPGEEVTALVYDDVCIPTTTAVTIESSEVAHAVRLNLLISEPTQSQPSSHVSQTNSDSLGSTQSITRPSILSASGTSPGTGSHLRGAKIAAGVIIPIIIILLSAVSILALRRRRLIRRQAEPASKMLNTSTASNIALDKPELEASPGTTFFGAEGCAYQKPELEATEALPPNKRDHPSAPNSTRQVAELDASATSLPTTETLSPLSARAITSHYGDEPWRWSQSLEYNTEFDSRASVSEALTVAHQGKALLSSTAPTSDVDIMGHTDAGPTLDELLAEKAKVAKEIELRRELLRLSERQDEIQKEIEKKENTDLKS